MKALQDKVKALEKENSYLNEQLIKIDSQKKDMTYNNEN